MNQPGWLVGAQLIGIGWYIAGTVVLGAVGGAWLDGLIGTSPLFLLLGVLLGIGLALYGTYRMVVGVLVGKTDSQKNRER